MVVLPLLGPQFDKMFCLIAFTASSASLNNSFASATAASYNEISDASALLIARAAVAAVVVAAAVVVVVVVVLFDFAAANAAIRFCSEEKPLRLSQPCCLIELRLPLSPCLFSFPLVRTCFE